MTGLFSCRGLSRTGEGRAGLGACLWLRAMIVTSMASVVQHRPWKLGQAGINWRTASWAAGFISANLSSHSEASLHGHLWSARLGTRVLRIIAANKDSDRVRMSSLDTDIVTRIVYCYTDGLKVTDLKLYISEIY